MVKKENKRKQNTNPINTGGDLSAPEKVSRSLYTCVTRRVTHTNTNIL